MRRLLACCCWLFPSMPILLVISWKVFTVTWCWFWLPCCHVLACFWLVLWLVLVLMIWRFLFVGVGGSVVFVVGGGVCLYVISWCCCWLLLVLFWYCFFVGVGVGVDCDRLLFLLCCGCFLFYVCM